MLREASPTLQRDNCILFAVSHYLNAIRKVDGRALSLNDTPNAQHRVPAHRHTRGRAGAIARTAARF
jgi:hypothetical protein